MAPVSPLTIEYWELNANCSPVFDFILEVEPERARAKIQAMIELLGELGMSLLTNPRVFQKIAGVNNLYELRISWGKTAYRILVVVKNSIAYLVHAFKKQKQREMQHIRLGIQRRDLIFSYSLAN